MKKILITLLALVMAVSLYAAAPTDGTTDSYFWMVQDNQAITIDDTIVGDGDSLFLLTKFEPKQGWEYILKVGDFSGTHGDSVKISIEVACYDADGNLYNRPAIDSITTTALAEDILIPFGATLIGRSFTVILKDYNDGTIQAIPGNFTLYRRVSYGWDYITKSAKF